MTTLRQIEANRRNALKSTGPRTEDGKRRSRRNALRHGLAAETVVEILEDVDDYKRFESAVISDYEPRSAVERELVLRLASLLWRLRRATALETALLGIEAEGLPSPHAFNHDTAPEESAYRSCREAKPPNGSWELAGSDNEQAGDEEEVCSGASRNDTRQLAYSLLRLTSLDCNVFERLSRYEARLWRQTLQTLVAVNALKRPNLF